MSQLRHLLLMLAPAALNFAATVEAMKWAESGKSISPMPDARGTWHGGPQRRNGKKIWKRQRRTCGHRKWTKAKAGR